MLARFNAELSEKKSSVSGKTTASLDQIASAKVRFGQYGLRALMERLHVNCCHSRFHCVAPTLQENQLPGSMPLDRARDAAAISHVRR
jgi:hypothetical protein